MRVGRRSSLSKNGVIFNPDCIFCKKIAKKAIKVCGMWTTEGTKVFERGGGEAVKDEARKKEDYELLRRIS